MTAFLRLGAIVFVSHSIARLVTGDAAYPKLAVANIVMWSIIYLSSYIKDDER